MIETAPIRHFPSIDSTNLEARRLAEAGVYGPLWLVADEQTGGKGRLGRRWQSPKGNLYVSLLLPVETSLLVLPQIGFAVALAVHDVAVEWAKDKSVRLKWPNDCLVDGGKVAGVLCEAVSTKPTTVAIGCGINVGSLPGGLPYPAARLADARVADVFSRYRAALYSRLEQWNHGEGFSATIADWQTRAIGIGETVSISENGVAHSGVFTGLADDGAMWIELATGPQRFYAGDVTIPSLQELRNTRP